MNWSERTPFDQSCIDSAEIRISFRAVVFLVGIKSNNRAKKLNILFWNDSSKNFQNYHHILVDFCNHIHF